jgi:hypothetical protein
MAAVDPNRVYSQKSFPVFADNIERDQSVRDLYARNIFNTNSSSVPLTGNGQFNIVQFTTSGTYTPSARMTSCIIEAWGAGGGGGSSAAAGAGNSAASGGGAGGSYSQTAATLAQIAGTAAVTVAGTTAAASDGASSSVVANGGSGATLVLAPGGHQGVSAAASTSLGYTNLGGSGNGTGQVGTVKFVGNQGFPGMVFTAGGGGTSVVGGAGGAAGLSAGGAAAYANTAGNGQGAPGGLLSFGGGGGGAVSSNGSGAATGGTGSPGLVRIIEILSNN